MSSVLEPICLGVQGSSYPTTRPDGTALQNGDYLTVSGTENVERYISGKWIVNAVVWQKTSDMPLVDPSVESLDATDKTQSDLNATLKDSLFPVGCIVTCNTGAAATVKSMYGGNSWTLLKNEYTNSYDSFSKNGFTTFMHRQGLMCCTAFWNANGTIDSATNVQIVEAISSDKYPDSRLWVPSSGNNSVGIGELVQGYQQVHRGAVYMNTFRNVTVYNNSGSAATNQQFEGGTVYRVQAGNVSTAYYIWKRTS